MLFSNPWSRMEHIQKPVRKVTLQWPIYRLSNHMCFLIRFMEEHNQQFRKKFVVY
jgi:hypothetical protein